MTLSLTNVRSVVNPRIPAYFADATHLSQALHAATALFMSDASSVRVTSAASFLAALDGAKTFPDAVRALELSEPFFGPLSGSPVQLQSLVVWQQLHHGRFMLIFVDAGARCIDVYDSDPVVDNKTAQGLIDDFYPQVQAILGKLKSCFGFQMTVTVYGKKVMVPKSPVAGHVWLFCSMYLACRGSLRTRGSMVTEDLAEEFFLSVLSKVTSKAVEELIPLLKETRSSIKGPDVSKGATTPCSASITSVVDDLPTPLLKEPTQQSSKSTSTHEEEESGVPGEYYNRPSCLRFGSRVRDPDPACSDDLRAMSLQEFLSYDRLRETPADCYLSLLKEADMEPCGLAVTADVDGISVISRCLSVFQGGVSFFAVPDPNLMTSRIPVRDRMVFESRRLHEYANVRVATSAQHGVDIYFLFPCYAPGSLNAEEVSAIFQCVFDVLHSLDDQYANGESVALYRHVVSAAYQTGVLDAKLSSFMDRFRTLISDVSGPLFRGALIVCRKFGTRLLNALQFGAETAERCALGMNLDSPEIVRFSVDVGYEVRVARPAGSVAIATMWNPGFLRMVVDDSKQQCSAETGIFYKACCYDFADCFVRGKGEQNFTPGVSHIKFYSTDAHLLRLCNRRPFAAHNEAALFLEDLISTTRSSDAVTRKCSSMLEAERNMQALYDAILRNVADSSVAARVEVSFTCLEWYGYAKSVFRDLSEISRKGGSNRFFCVPSSQLAGLYLKSLAHIEDEASYVRGLLTSVRSATLQMSDADLAQVESKFVLLYDMRRFLFDGDVSTSVDRAVMRDMVSKLIRRRRFFLVRNETVLQRATSGQNSIRNIYARHLTYRMSRQATDRLVAEVDRAHHLSRAVAYVSSVDEAELYACIAPTIHLLIEEYMRFVHCDVAGGKGKPAFTMHRWESVLGFTVENTAISSDTILKQAFPKLVSADELVLSSADKNHIQQWKLLTHALSEKIQQLPGYEDEESISAVEKANQMLITQLLLVGVRETVEVFPVLVKQGTSIPQSRKACAKVSEERRRQPALFHTDRRSAVPPLIMSEAHPDASPQPEMRNVQVQHEFRLSNPTFERIVRWRSVRLATKTDPRKPRPKDVFYVMSFARDIFHGVKSPCAATVNTEKSFLWYSKMFDESCFINRCKTWKLKTMNDLANMSPSWIRKTIPNHEAKSFGIRPVDALDDDYDTPVDFDIEKEPCSDDEPME